MSNDEAKNQFYIKKDDMNDLMNQDESNLNKNENKEAHPLLKQNPLESFSRIPINEVEEQDNENTGSQIKEILPELEKVEITKK